MYDTAANVAQSVAEQSSNNNYLPWKSYNAIVKHLHSILALWTTNSSMRSHDRHVQEHDIMNSQRCRAVITLPQTHNWQMQKH